MVILLAIATVVWPARIQAQPGMARQYPTFDVASVRRATGWVTGGEGSKRSSITSSPNSLTMRNVNLIDCLGWAFRVQPHQIAGPSLIGSERYDILAKAHESVAVDELRAMLQDLLATRFKLRVHRESKERRVYELVVAKRGSRLPVPKVDADLSALHSVELLPRVQDGNFVFQDISIPEFAVQLSHLRGIDLPVVDRTGIKGVFDINLRSAASAMLLQTDGPSLFTLIKEQLGLELKTGKAIFSVIVVDHVEKPSEN